MIQVFRNIENMGFKMTIIIDGSGLSVEKLVKVARHNEKIKLHPDSLKKIRKETMNIIEKEVISHVLNQTGWNRTKASKILKISYKTLLYKIKDLGIEPPDGSEE